MTPQNKCGYHGLRKAELATNSGGSILRGRSVNRLMNPNIKTLDLSGSDLTIIYEVNRIVVQDENRNTQSISFIRVLGCQNKVVAIPDVLSTISGIGDDLRDILTLLGDLDLYQGLEFEDEIQISLLTPYEKSTKSDQISSEILRFEQLPVNTKIVFD